MRQYLDIMRPLNCTMASFAVLIGAKMGGPLQITVLYAIAATFLICAAGNTANDYYDYQIDKINSPNRPIPSGKITRKGAHQYALTLFILAIMLATQINMPALMLAVINSMALYLYAATIKQGGGLTKNLTVSYLVASPFLLGGLASENPSVTLFLVFVAFLVNTSREIVKDIEDFEGDKDHLESLPVKYGFRLPAIVASFFLAASILLSIVPAISGVVSSLYLPFIVVADLILTGCIILLSPSPKNSSPRVQRLIKKAMILALLGFFIGSF